MADAGVGTEAARRLRLVEAKGTRLTPGLTDAEFDRVEHTYGFEFAADHRAFLAECLPVNLPFEPEPGVITTWARPWPDWRDGDPGELRAQIGHPVQGVVFDVEHNVLWPQDWGQRPEETADALAIAMQRLAAVPALVPVYGHRYLPAGREYVGHPVLSVWQTDIICYGTDIADYIDREFGDTGLVPPDQSWHPRPTVPFWSDFI